MILKRPCTVKNRLGLHARPAGILAQAARKFQAEIMIEKNGQEADCKSIIDILTLACPAGTELTIKADGEDAESALDSLERLIEGQLDGAEDHNDD